MRVLVVFALVAAGFAVAWVALLLRAPWWAPVAMSAAVATAATLLLALVVGWPSSVDGYERRSRSMAPT